MKKINFNFIKFIFVSIFVFAPLFLSFSYADFTSTPVMGTPISYSNSFSSTHYYRENGVNISYSYNSINTIVKNYISNPDNIDYKSAFDILISYFENDLNKNVFVTSFNNNANRYFLFVDKNSPLDVGIHSNRLYFDSTTSDFIYFNGCDYLDSAGQRYYSNVAVPISSYVGYVNCLSLIYSSPSVSIKQLSYTSGSGCYWDGASYYYESPKEPEEEPPTLPSNAEIAQAVQNFYNSDYYKNNKDFEDFFVLYNYETQYFDFIGHNHGIDIGQVIVPPDYEYDGYTYKQQWWKFFLRNLSSQISSKLWNSYYWLYSTNDLGENITYEGKGSINDLLNLHFSTSSTIVYSTTDYPVTIFEKNDETGFYGPVEGTIPGNQYTYDENLDPTKNEYNPLENFVPFNPVDTALGNFSSSDILDIVNQNIISWTEMSWVFTSVSTMFNIFSSLLLLICVLILISKIIGG